MSERTRENLRTAAQFKQLVTPSGKKAFEAHLAVWMDDGIELALCAPSLDALENASAKLFSRILDRQQAQLVWIVKAKEV